MGTQIKNVLFDLDGTLADTAPDLAGTLNQLLEENNRAPLPFEVIRPMVSHGGIYMVSQAFAITIQHPEFGKLRERFLSIYESYFLTRQTRLFEGISELLARLETDGYKWGIVTNKTERLTLPLIEALNLNKRTGCTVCGDTVTYNKPHPAPMLHACKLIGGLPYETIFLGDARNDVSAGKNAGMHTLVASYGYIGRDEDPLDWGADGIIDSPLELLDWLDNYRRKKS